MKFPLSWLKEYLDTTADVQTIADTLTAIGLEVDSVEDNGDIYQDFVIGHVRECGPHPNADRLNLTKVYDGKKEYQVVCGAPNVAKGQNICFAPPGTEIPSNGLVIKEIKIRDIASNGMICSESELELSDESDGIMVLPDDAPVGESFADYMGLNDPVIDIELTPDRADCAGVYGIARDLAAAGLGKLKPLKVKSVKGTFKSKIGVSIKDKEACPHFIGREIKGVKNGPSPLWLQNRLRAAGLRPISALVDITNYLCIGLNRPLHFFDGGKINGSLNVRLSKSGETIDALDDKSYTLNDEITVITDDNGVQALGGVIGGEETSCDDKTTSIFIECAYFDRDRTRTTGQTLFIDSDAKYRFERGIDPQFSADGMEIATRMVLDLCAGEASELVEAGSAPNPEQAVKFDTERVQSLGGVDLPITRQKEILQGLGFEIKGSGKTLDVTVPPWRVDIEVGTADLVEEILRIEGYDNIPTEQLPRTENVTRSAYLADQKRLRTVKTALANQGLMETVTWSFLSDKDATPFEYGDYKQVQIANPISQDLSIMRQSILPNLIRAAARNHDKGFANSALFETGPVFWGQTPESQPDMIAAVRTGQFTRGSWDNKARVVDAFDAKADMLTALAAAGINAESMPLSRDVPSWYHPGRSGAINLGPKQLAVFGEIHPQILQDWDIDVPVVGFEVNTNHLPNSKDKGPGKPLLRLSQLQPLTRDFAFIVDEDTPVQEILKTAQSADRNLISDVHLFDLYQGKGVEDGKKSVAITITLQPQDKTLTNDQIEALSQDLVSMISKKTGATLRS